jgi:pilus assembly protein CpaC
MIRHMLKAALSLILFFTTSIAVFAQTSPTQGQEEEVEVVIGISKILQLDFIPGNIQVSSDQILRYTLVPAKRELILTGLKPGKTDIIVRDQATGDIKKRYLVNVTENQKSKILQELREFVGDVEGLEIGLINDQVFIGGQIVVPGDIGRVVTILETDKFREVMMLVELSPQTQLIIARKMQEEIQKSGMRDVTVRVVNGSFILEGIVASEPEAVRALQIAKIYLPDRIESLARRTDSVQQNTFKGIIETLIQINPKSQPPQVPKMIKVTAQFVELTKNYQKIFGFQWEPVMSGDGGNIRIGKTSDGGVSTQSSGTLSATISQLFPKLQSAKNAGYARIVQSGVIIVKDNDQDDAEINKTNSETFSVGSGEFTRAQTNDVGFNLKLKAQTFPEEKVHLGISLGVSSTIGGSATSTQKNQLSTRVVVKSKDSAVVGGIVINNSTTNYDKPTGDQVEGGSPLFSFNRSKDYTTNKSQFAMFITPEILDNITEGTEEIQRKFRRRGR